MSGIKLSKKQEELIEKLGVFLERSGSAPAQARIIALLMISDRTELSFDEIRETLKLSKSATSNSLNALLSTDRITYTTKMGDRKRYFKSRLITMEHDFGKRVAKILDMKDIYQEILENRTKETAEFNFKLEQLIDFLGYLQQEFPALIEKWKASQKK